MNTKRKRKILGIGSGIFIILVIAFISWYYPLSLLSIDQSFAYSPDTETHNGKTYEEEIGEFKAAYEKDLKMDLESNNYNPTVNRTQFILPIFEQQWLIGMDSKTIDKDKLDRMLFDVQQARNTLLDLVSEGDYSREERVYLVDSINNFLKLEDSIRFIRTGTYFSRSDLHRLLGNLQAEFWAGFDYYTTVFYDASHT
ncbi:hypothetical protein CSV71_15535 [Sporosarcina sp. P21c]|uniref:hypothetical protein n=1 Tax=Sporosarcina TaxID=1569 RepID=UPI000A151C8F|nr:MULTISPECIES: hypothetical protein [Sporosarcina]ARJ37501.1 hypothetical protein SporoP8_00570 [Sporosarcina ureae]PIC65957.1 hypothetical protein CSV78_15000 [Sporosarcina sp. P16a]PIC81876.1 hypothetical protein CSV73_15325 [Sporosarcina sp. P1]PIC88293.1 hypothetical protein CSV71_15535 [Sporosarcina sp. P21c]PIC91473.1 hypothetical protein CSV70_15430 [Sporosarcina sp. P25]